MALKFFLEAILLLKEDCFEGILNRNKIDGMVKMIIQVAVTHNNLK